MARQTRRRRTLTRKLPVLPNRGAGPPHCPSRPISMGDQGALGLYLSAFESFPFALHVTLCLAPIEVAHDGGHSCAMEQDRDQHNERQCAPKEVGRFESTLLERVGQVVHGTQPPNAVEADHSSLRRWATGTRKADPAG